MRTLIDQLQGLAEAASLTNLLQDAGGDRLDRIDILAVLVGPSPGLSATAINPAM
jgi:hypothetical protein